MCLYAGCKKNKTNENEANKKFISNTEIVKEVVFSTAEARNNMVFVKGGMFQMGNNEFEDSKPVHKVKVSDYFIGKYEVTQKEWEEVMGNNPSYFHGPYLPVDSVSWDDVQEFIRKLNAKTGDTYRLPTEAEWEYAAKGGNISKGYEYSGGNDQKMVAWSRNNSGDKTHEIGEKQPNELYLYDMSGNVWEWCQDWFGSYQNQPQTNPTGSPSGHDRVVRGGSWGSVDLCRLTYRGRIIPSDRYDVCGFRLALDL